MAAFKFNMEFLLTLRRRREEEAAASLAKRLATIRELERRIAGMDEVRENLQSDLQEHIRKGQVSPALLSLYSDFQTKLFQDRKGAEELLALSQREEIKERTALRQAVMERQVMERFRERKEADWKADDMRQEQNSIEEMAALMKARRLRIEKDVP
ncbi:MAG: flagellar export protein FliJ [Deltaproteobacteria bacterium]|jgi:flagellar FliJ protein|nr:flagellar export protein FliJ [Deltaproteobacteria bacterium]